MEYLRGWRAMRQDPEWISKIGIACLLFMIPVVGPIVFMGWQALLLRRVVSGQESPLPRLDFDMDYLMKLLTIGFKAYLARLLWSLPVMVVAFGTCFCGYAAAGFAVWGGAAAGGESGGTIAGIIAVIVIGIVYVAGMVGAQMPMQVAMTRSEITDDMNAAMRFGEVMSMTKLLMRELIVGNFVLALVGSVAVFFGLITCYIGLLPAMAVMGVIGTYWQAEIYRAYIEKGGQPLPIGPLDVEGPPPPQRPGPTY